MGRLIPALCLLALVATAPSQVVLNRIDDFQDATLMGWGGGSFPTNIASGGPQGAGDRYLQINSTGFHLATHNTSRWSGNFPAAGVDRVEADLRNTGANPLHIRLVLFGPNLSRWSSNAVFVLPPGSAWTRVAFSLTASNFTQTMGTDPFSVTIAAMDRVMFRHEPVISTGGATVTGTLGIDNVSAFAQVNDVQPSAFAIVSGVPVSGGLAEVLESDDLYAKALQNVSRSRQDPAIIAEASSVAPPGSFATLEFTLETSTNAVPAALLTQRIQLWSFSLNDWVLVDSRPCTTGDSTALVSPGNPNAFVHPTTRQVRARLSYMDPGTLVTRSWNMNFDLIRWRLIR